jgi:superfamily II DNA helicase RecQ
MSYPGRRNDLRWVPVRQWVLTVPHRLRYRLAFDHTLCRAVIAVFVRAVLGWYRRRADVLGHRRLQDAMDDPAARRTARAKTVALFELAEAPGCRWQRLVGYFDERIAARSACDFCRGTTLADLVRPASTSAPAPRPEAPDGELFQRLRALRRTLAEAEGVPAYIVFSDAVLARMTAVRPTDEAGLLAVSGVGPAKLARYGAAFLRALRAGPAT